MPAGEALKLDPEHKACKADYKQAKKLGKLLEKIEARAHSVPQPAPHSQHYKGSTIVSAQSAADWIETRRARRGAHGS